MRSILMYRCLDFCAVYTGMGGVGSTIPSTLYIESLTVER